MLRCRKQLTYDKQDCIIVKKLSNAAAFDNLIVRDRKLYYKQTRMV